jgi:hypothetical protein
MVAPYIFRFTFGALAVFLGLGIIAWVCYNEFVERLPQYGGFHSISIAVSVIDLPRLALP